MKKINIEELKAKISREELYDLYITQNKTQKEVQDYYPISEAYLKKLLIEYGIKKQKADKNIIIDKDELYKLYIVEDKSTKDIQRKYNITEERLFKLLKSYNISKTKYNNLQDIILSEKVKILYIDQNLTQKEVCNCLNITIGKFLVIIHKFKLVKTKENIQKNKRIAMHKNNSFLKSKIEEQFAYFLKIIYPNVKRQYRSEDYPFLCDFYIPEIDTYIECQGFEGHGKEPFNDTNPKHKEILEKWKDRAPKSKVNRSQYSRYIKTWTIRDPLKRDTARKNNLNWLEFFTIDEFLSWYRDQTGVLLLTYNP